MPAPLPAPPRLQDAYNNGNGVVILTSTGGPLAIKDNATPIAASLLKVSNNGVSNVFLDINSSATQVIRSGIADGASVGTAIDTTTAWVSTTAKILSIRNGGTEKLYIDRAGGIYSPSTANALTIASNVTDGASAVGISFNNQATMQTTGSTLLEIKNNGTRKFSFHQYNASTYTAFTSCNLGATAFSIAAFQGAPDFTGAAGTWIVFNPGGTSSTGSLDFYASGVDLLNGAFVRTENVSGAHNFRPNSGGGWNLGTSSNPWTTLFATNIGSAGFVTTYQGGTKVNTKTTAVSYTAVAGDYLIWVTDLTVSRTITLPSAVTAGAGTEYVVQDRTGLCDATHTITISAGATNINGAGSYVISTPYGKVVLVSDGANWYC